MNFIPFSNWRPWAQSIEWWISINKLYKLYFSIGVILDQLHARGKKIWQNSPGNYLFFCIQKIFLMKKRTALKRKLRVLFSFWRLTIQLILCFIMNCHGFHLNIFTLSNKTFFYDVFATFTTISCDCRKFWMKYLEIKFRTWPRHFSLWHIHT